MTFLFRLLDSLVETIVKILLLPVLALGALCVLVMVGAVAAPVLIPGVLVVLLFYVIVFKIGRAITRKPEERKKIKARTPEPRERDPEKPRATLAPVVSGIA